MRNWPSTPLSSSPLCADEEPHRRCAEVDGATLVATRRHKERTYPELVGDSGRAKRARRGSADVSLKKRTLSSVLAKAKTLSIPEPLRTRARQSWVLRWGSIEACAAARAFASSLLIVRATRELRAPQRRVLKFLLISSGRHVLRGSQPAMVFCFGVVTVTRD